MSKSGSGGGAIELIAIDGTLTIGKKTQFFEISTLKRLN